MAAKGGWRQHSRGIGLLACTLILATDQTAWSTPVMNDSQGSYSDNFDSAQGVGLNSNIQVDTGAHSIYLVAGQTVGWVQSNAITPISLQNWQSLDANVSLPAGTAVTFSVVDTNNSTVLGGFTAAAGDNSFDLSTIPVATQALVLRADISGTVADTPVLNSWSLHWAVKPNVFFRMRAATDTDASGVSVTAKNDSQIQYTISYDINNVNAHNVVISTTATAQDGYGVAMINYNTASAVPAPNSAPGDPFMVWNLGDLSAGTSGTITFTVNAPNGTTCSRNSATHIGGRPIALNAAFASTETGSQGIVSSPSGNSLVGSGGMDTLTYVQSAPSPSFTVVYPQYAIPGRAYTYILKLTNYAQWGGGDETMHNVTVTSQIPAGTTYVTSGLYTSGNFSNGPFASAESSPGSGQVRWTVGKMVPDAIRNVYLYTTVNLPSGWTPGTTFTLPAVTLANDQCATQSSGTYTVTVVAESTVDSNPNNYVRFGRVVFGSLQAAPCDILQTGQYIMNNVNKPLVGAYVVEPIPDFSTFNRDDAYYYFYGANGDISPAGNSAPAFYSTTVTAASLPDPPNLASGIWYPGNSAQNFGTVTFALADLGCLNFTLDMTGPWYYDGDYVSHYTIDGDAPNGAVVPVESWFYAHAGVPHANRLTTGITQYVISDQFTPQFGFYAFVSDKNPLAAGEPAVIHYQGYGHVRNNTMYTVFPPQIEFDPAGTTPYFLVRNSSCENFRKIWIEYTTSPNLYPFDLASAEHAQWTRLQPLDTTTITGVRWSLGNWQAWNGGQAFNYFVGIRAKSGTANNTVVRLTVNAVYDSIGAGPVPGNSILITILSNVQLSLAKTSDRNQLAAGKLCYYLNYGNTGNMDENQAVLWDRIPDNTQFIDCQYPATAAAYYSSNPSATLPLLPGDWSTSDFGVSTTWVKWMLPGVAAGQLHSVTLTVKPQLGLPIGSVIANACSIVGAHSTTLTSNSVTLVNAPDFSDPATTYMTVDPTDQVKAGTTLKYMLNYYNAGLMGAHQVVIEDTLNANLDGNSIQYIAGPAAIYNPATRVIHWEIGNVPTGMSGQIVFSVAVRADDLPGGDITNAARIASNESPWVSTNTVSSALLTEIQTVRVQPLPKLEGMAAEYHFLFYTGNNGQLNPGDVINIEFPSAMILPAAVAAGVVTVNGIPTQQAGAVSGKNLAVPVPQTVAGGSRVEVIASRDAGIRNPARGTYTVNLNSSVETIWKTSEPFSVLLYLGDGDVVVAPNPVHGDLVKFFYNMPSAGEVEIDIYNVMGEKAARITERKAQEKGACSVWHAGKAGSGVYLSRIKLHLDGGQNVVLPPRKVIVVH